jgi:hypothetical protein
VKRTAFLLSATGKRKLYPVPDDTVLKDEYDFDGVQYRVVAVKTEYTDTPNLTPAMVPEAR